MKKLYTLQDIMEIIPIKYKTLNRYVNYLKIGSNNWECQMVVPCVYGKKKIYLLEEEKEQIIAFIMGKMEKNIIIVRNILMFEAPISKTHLKKLCKSKRISWEKVNDILWLLSQETYEGKVLTECEIDGITKLFYIDIEDIGCEL